MQISIKATQVKLSDDVHQYIQQKLNSLDKFATDNLGAAVEIGLISQHHQTGTIYRAEVNLRLPGGMIRVEKEAKTLFKAIDKVKDHLKIMLVGRKEKNRDKKRRSNAGEINS